MTGTSANLRQAKAEVALAKKLQGLLVTGEASFFFKAHADRHWSEFDAWDAWCAWLPGKLTSEEWKLYQDRYENECLDHDELAAMLAIEANRVPSEWNEDGY